MFLRTQITNNRYVKPNNTVTKMACKWETSDILNPQLTKQQLEGDCCTLSKSERVYKLLYEK
jgi:hypothetical protein